MSAFNPDQMRYLVFCDHRDGEYSPERPTCDMDRKTTISDITHGQIENVVRVIEWNAVENICNDCTAEILAEAEALRDDDDRPLTGQNLQDWKWDLERKLRNEERA